MKTFSQQEYFELYQKFAEDQYLQDEEDYIQDDYWQESIKEKIEKSINNSVIDLTNAKGTDATDKLHNCRNFKVGNFSLKIIKYRGDPIGGIKLNIIIYEVKSNSKHINVVTRVNILKDQRFDTVGWRSYFKNSSLGEEIPLQKMSDIIRWLQAIQNLKTFL